MWKRFLVVEIRISKILEICFYPNFSFLGFRVVDKRTMIRFKGNEDFQILEFYLIGLKSQNLL